MKRIVDVAIVGAGIVGLAFAWEAARRGKSVVVFDKSRKAEGASIRNFGMVWPIGQMPGTAYQTAIRSRGRWLELRDEASVAVAECGSLHAAYEPDENAVVQEFAAKAAAFGIACEYVPASGAARRFPNLNPDGLHGVLYSPTELVVDPRQAIDRLAMWLAETHDVQILFHTVATDITMPHVRTANGDIWTAERVFVCSGTDFETLFPKAFAESGIRRCKLQMMRTATQPNGWSLGPHLAGGLTLCHYQSFEVCDTLSKLRSRFAEELPDYVRYGIHVMASQNHFGEIVIGDSHEYDGEISPFDNTRIDDLILAYFNRMLHLPDPRIVARWHGIYAKHPTKILYVNEPQPNCHIVNAPGGAGMTMSFGFAANAWDTIAADRPFLSVERNHES